MAMFCEVEPEVMVPITWFKRVCPGAKGKSLGSFTM
jgi:hypothetical protein